MTQALCLNCGDIKFGAICPCPQCQVASTGNMELDIAFSDHNISEESLRQLGGFLKSIQAATDDASLAFWTFMHFISERHSEVLSITLHQEIEADVLRIYGSLEIPEIILEPGHRMG